MSNLAIKFTVPLVIGCCLLLLLVLFAVITLVVHRRRKALNLRETTNQGDTVILEGADNNRSTDTTLHMHDNEAYGSAALTHMHSQLSSADHRVEEHAHDGIHLEHCVSYSMSGMHCITQSQESRHTESTNSCQRASVPPVYDDILPVRRGEDGDTLCAVQMKPNAAYGWPWTR